MVVDWIFYIRAYDTRSGVIKTILFIHTIQEHIEEEKKERKARKTNQREGQQKN